LQFVRAYIGKIRAGEILSDGEARGAMRLILEGDAKTPEIKDFLLALRERDYEVNELAAFVTEMRAHAKIIIPETGFPLIDNCGTGGGAPTFNISTAAAFVIAAAGIGVAKHGNRSFSSRCGSADVAEALGVKIDLPPERVERCIEEVGLGFLYAPNFHPAMKNAAEARSRIGGPTVFNLLGPLASPICPPPDAQIIGAYSDKAARLIALTAEKLELRGMVVYGGGIDELSVCETSHIYRIGFGKRQGYIITPEGFGARRAVHRELYGGDPKTSAAIIEAILRGKETGPKRDIVEANTGLAISLAGDLERARISKPSSYDLRIGTGIKKAAALIDSGAAYKKLKELREFTNAV